MYIQDYIASCMLDPQFGQTKDFNYDNIYWFFC
jgi:hypothetical protein